jgi:hypothetical protein
MQSIHHWKGGKCPVFKQAMVRVMCNTQNPYWSAPVQAGMVRWEWIDTYQGPSPGNVKAYKVLHNGI